MRLLECGAISAVEGVEGGGVRSVRYGVGCVWQRLLCSEEAVSGDGWGAGGEAGVYGREVSVVVVRRPPPFASCDGWCVAGSAVHCASISMVLCLLVGFPCVLHSWGLC